MVSDTRSNDHRDVSSIVLIFCFYCFSSCKNVSYPDFSRFSSCLSLHKQSSSISTA